MVCKTLIVKEAPIISCYTDADCPEGYRCETGVCVPVLPEVPWEWIAGIGIGTVVIGGVAYMLKKKRRKK